MSAYSLADVGGRVGNTGKVGPVRRRAIKAVGVLGFAAAAVCSLALAFRLRKHRDGYVHVAVRVRLLDAESKTPIIGVIVLTIPSHEERNRDFVARYLNYRESQPLVDIPVRVAALGITDEDGFAELQLVVGDEDVEAGGAGVEFLWIQGSGYRQFIAVGGDLQFARDKSEHKAVLDLGLMFVEKP